MTRYYDFLNESFNKMLNEARQDDINFANVFGEDLLARFKALKQSNRLSGQESDYYYWIRKSKEDLAGTIEDLDAFLSELESRVSRRERRRLASEGAEILYEDDEWLVLSITTYEAAAQYGSGTTWCITGRYRGHEDEGEHWFEHYKNEYGWDYYFYISKDRFDDEDRQEKWCLCYANDDDWCVYNAADENITEEGEAVPGAPKVRGLPDISQPNPHYDSEEDGDWNDDLDDEEEDNGPHYRQPPEFVNIDVEDPNAFEFPARSKEEAARAFKDGAEIIDTLREPDLFIVKWVEEPTGEVLGQDEEGNDIIDDNGDRFTPFVFINGEGGGPLLAQTGNGFALQVFRNPDVIRRMFGRMIGAEGGFDIRNNHEETEDMPECLRENFYYYNDNSWYYDL